MEALETIKGIWEKGEAESLQAYEAFCDYKNLGTERSFQKLLDFYARTYPQPVGHKPDTKNAPTHSMDTLKKWSRRYDWQGRVSAWDNARSRIEIERALMAVAQEHDRRLERFRQLNQDNGDAMLKLSKDLMAVGSAMLGVMAAELKKVQADQANGDRIALDKFTNATARLLSVASQLAQSGADISAVCLGMEPPGGAK